MWHLPAELVKQCKPGPSGSIVAMQQDGQLPHKTGAGARVPKQVETLKMKGALAASGAATGALEGLSEHKLPHETE